MIAAMVPNRGTGGNFNLALLFPVPLLDGQVLPSCVFVFRDFFQGGQALALLTWTTHSAFQRGGWFVERCIHAEARDHAHRIFELAELKKELNDGKTTVPR
jgi:hypothetical protein